MAQITDLNVSPYYDDFDEADNFHRVLFRPGFAIQARELTQLQSILQNQVERHGSHMFKEGSIVIPGQLSYSNDFPTLQLASTFASEEIDPSQFYDATNPVTITGATTFTFSNAPTSVVYSFTMEVTLNGSNAITWPAAVKWNGDAAPTITDAKTQLFMFITDDGGTRWRGSALVDYVN